MRERNENNYAFIDSQNLNLGVRALGWQLDFRKFRVYLKDKYGVKKAYLFVGYVHGNERMYAMLRNFGYHVVFKPTLKNESGIVKGNCDGELILQAMIDYGYYDTAIIVTGDGDFHCLAKYLLEKNKLKTILIPNGFKYSVLLNRFRSYLSFLNNLRDKLEYKKEKAP